MPKKERVILIIRDGYGRRDIAQDNAVILGDTHYTDQLMKDYPTTTLRTSGVDVGLPHGFMGGSEVGHMTIGSGRIIKQQLGLIDETIQNGSFYENKAFLETIAKAKEHNSTIHLMGLLQDSGVHAHCGHLFALLELCKRQNIAKEKVAVHVFSDGRDTPSTSSIKYITNLQDKIDEIGVGKIVTVIGRYYAMDRDKRFDRTKLAYDALVDAKGTQIVNVIEAVKNAHASDETDEFIKPLIMKGYNGFSDNDCVIFYNYRGDRARQITHAFVDEEFNDFERVKKVSLHFCAMAGYYDALSVPIAFGKKTHQNLLGNVIAQNNLKQLRISETEKYPHVTFFFNGLNDTPNKDEDWTLIPSPREVATYDEKPEMSIYEIKDKLDAAMETEEYDLIVVNYVNGDMVGHTGKLDAAIAACEAVDHCVEATVKKALEHDYTLLIFADHGNCEEMAGVHQTSHTLNDVDCLLVSNNPEYSKDKIELNYGGLCDVAPTALAILGLDKPQEMSGKSLIKRK